ncbi:hypothetical protein C2W62_38780 [Candidatus Entotheonella serta]|nr:hypothetical protein C2W62_38780 [Candidatus Entotheonella serta]
MLISHEAANNPSLLKTLRQSGSPEASSELGAIREITREVSVSTIAILGCEIFMFSSYLVGLFVEREGPCEQQEGIPSS